jgi:hypothetical protein
MKQHTFYIYLTFNIFSIVFHSCSKNLLYVCTYWVIQNDCGQVWQLCMEIYVATV